MKEVVGIYISPDKGEPMIKRDKVLALAGHGIVGDRYAAGKGAYSKVGDKPRQISLISKEAIEGSGFSEEETRRNIVVDIGVEELNNLIGKEFQIGMVKLRGAWPCEPCDRPFNLAEKPGFKGKFEGKGGIRAEVLTDGLIVNGATVGEVVDLING